MQQLQKLLVLSLSFAFLALITSCGGGKQDLTLDLKQGQGYHMTMDQTIKQSRSGMGPRGGSESSQKQTIEYDMQVKSVDDSGNYVMEVTYTRVKGESSSQRGSSKYDTDSDTAGQGQGLTQGSVYKPLIGKSVEMVVSPKGKVKEIRGKDSLIQQVTSEATGGQPTPQDSAAQRRQRRQKLQVMQMLRGGFGGGMQGNLANNFVQQKPILPQNEVAPGDTWSLQQQKPMPMTMTYTYEGKQDGQHVVKMKGELKKEQIKQRALQQMKRRLGKKGSVDMSLDADIKATYKLDPETGWVSSATKNYKMNNEVTIQRGGQKGGKGQTMSSSNTITSDITAKPIKETS
jgi:hypothetical protein